MKVFTLLFMFLLLPAVAVAGPFEDGQDAYAHGDYQTALKLWQPLADQGNARAQFLLGWMYRHGAGVKPDTVEAQKWYRKAADQGNAKAQYSLAMMYWWGTGNLPKDYAESARLYRKAADQGDSYAQLSLGRMYERGFGVPPDLVQAYMWVSLAKAAGNKFSASALEGIAAKMTPAQITEAARLAASWRPTPATAANP